MKRVPPHARTCRVYVIEGPDGVYVGSTSASAERRWKQHQNNARSSKSLCAFYAAIRKHGADAFTVRVLFDGLTAREARTAEVETMHEFDADGVHLYNANRLGGGRFAQELSA